MVGFFGPSFLGNFPHVLLTPALLRFREGIVVALLLGMETSLRSPSHIRESLVPESVNLAAALALPLSGYFYKVNSKARSDALRARPWSGPLTPPPGAFAVWGPLFLASLVSSIFVFQKARGGRPLSRRLVWLSSSTFLFSSLWNLNTQRFGLRWPSVGIIGASAALAVSTFIQSSRRASSQVLSNMFAPLAGWLTVASFANLETTLNRTGRRVYGKAEDDRAVAILAAASTAARTLTRASHGHLGLFSTLGWGFAGIALKAHRQKRPDVRSAALFTLGTLIVTVLNSRPKPVEGTNLAVTRN